MAFNSLTEKQKDKLINIRATLRKTLYEYCYATPLNKKLYILLDEDVKKNLEFNTVHVEMAISKINKILKNNSYEDADSDFLNELATFAKKI